MNCASRLVDLEDYAEVEDTAWCYNNTTSPISNNINNNSLHEDLNIGWRKDLVNKCNTQEDLKVDWRKDLPNIQDGSILTRIIRCQNSITLPAKSGMCITSNILFLSSASNYDNLHWSYTERCSLQVRVNNLTKHWLADQAISSIWCKEGGVSLSISNRLSVWLFNRTDKNLTLSPGTAVAELQTSRLEYE